MRHIQTTRCPRCGDPTPLHRENCPILIGKHTGADLTMQQLREVGETL